MSEATVLKDAGNKAFAAKQYDEAIALFSKAIALEPKNHVFYSNRSAAKAGKRLWIDALEDAEETIRCNPTWSKGYARKGAALHGARRWDAAIAAYEAGLAIEDSPALRKGLQEVKDAKATDQGSDAFGKMFSDPNTLSKLAANPKTAPFLSDPSFVQKIQMIQNNPRMADSMLSDPRMITVLGVLLGIDMQGFSRPEGSTDMPEEMASNFTPQPTTTSAPLGAKSRSSPPKETPVVESTESQLPDSDLEAKSAAELEKRQGNEAYRKRDFAEAERAFSKAWDIWPKDITYLTNLGAVHFEQGEYDKCIETCEKAIEEGRSIRADFKLIAKALGRIGSAFVKKEDLDAAIRYFEKSLTEHRTPDILNKLREVEKQKSEAERLAYINPNLAEEERERGNQLFKAGDFAAAVKAYTEAIKRNPSDARGYNNRATAYTKLAALPEALKDAERAIEIDSSFVKAHIRRSTILFSMKDYTKAMEAAEKASEFDVEHKQTNEIDALVTKINQELYAQRAGETDEQTVERAMRDPEIAAIMTDPVMQSILQQAQSNPAALQDHMKNPMIQQKILKLVQAGIIKTGR